jgi:probable DNA metabolism protein
MIVFRYDKTFDGLLTVVFDAFFRKAFPDALLRKGEPLPLFYDEAVEVITDEEKSGRVWKGLQKKLSSSALSMLTTCWLSELPEIDQMLFRYMRKTIDAPVSMELNFGDPDVLELARVWKGMNWEKIRIEQFVRFQKTADGVFFAPFEPVHNALPLTVRHFKDRFADQKWLIYDLKRQYGYYYDLTDVAEVTFESPETHLVTGMLDESIMAEDEKTFQQLWKTYFGSIAIKERINPRLQKQHIPVRYWKYLTERNE